MKKCPTCRRTFEDSMRFCQSDGTPLVDDAPPVDPYKTMVASSDELKAAMGDQEPAAKVDEEVLQLPQEADPKKTMYVSEEELRKEMRVQDEPVVELPPLAPEPPKFSEPSLSPPPAFGDAAPAASPPPSPFSPGGGQPKSDFGGEPPFMKTTPPIPSPFDKQNQPTYDRPVSYAPPEPEPAFSAASSPLEPASPASWAAAPTPVQNWEPNNPMQNVPASPALQGQNKTLAIVSLVAGILGLTVCCGSLLPSLLAIVLGFMAKSKAGSDPVNYGGSGLALGGIITGVLGLVAGIAVLALYFLGFAASLMQNMPR